MIPSTIGSNKVNELRYQWGVDHSANTINDFPPGVTVANGNTLISDARLGKVIEVTAKKYEFNPSPIHVKQGAKVQLKITATDHTHGFKINLYPDGAPTTGDPGIVFTTKEDCFEIKQGAPVVVEFVAHTPGTYTFKCCKHCGLGHGGMKGQLVVEP